MTFNFHLSLRQYYSKFELFSSRNGTLVTLNFERLRPTMCGLLFVSGLETVPFTTGGLLSRTGRPGFSANLPGGKPPNMGGRCCRLWLKPTGVEIR